MFSDFALGTVRRNARVGLSVPMQAMAQGGQYRSLRVAPNVSALNAARAINAKPSAAVGPVGAVPSPGMASAMRPLGQVPAMTPQQAQAPAVPPGLVRQANPAVAFALAQIGQAMMKKG